MRWEKAWREVQAVLHVSGHTAGPLDARIGPETRAAMVEYAKSGA
jgi:hypothetical protein